MYQSENHEKFHYNYNDLGQIYIITLFSQNPLRSLFVSVFVYSETQVTLLINSDFIEENFICSLKKIAGGFRNRKNPFQYFNWYIWGAYSINLFFETNLRY